MYFKVFCVCDFVLNKYTFRKICLADSFAGLSVVNWLCKIYSRA